MAPLVPASRMIALAGNARAAPDTASTRPMPNPLLGEPLNEVKLPPTTTTDPLGEFATRPAGETAIALTEPSSADGFHPSSAPLDAENAASRVRATLLADVK